MKTGEIDEALKTLMDEEQKEWEELAKSTSWFVYGEDDTPEKLKEMIKDLDEFDRYIIEKNKGSLSNPNYFLTLRVPINARDDVEVRLKSKDMIDKFETYIADPSSVKLQEIFDDKEPRKIDL